ncbi:MAG: RHS repeat domain-containing protein [Acidobacteriota bacterium]
MTRDQVSSVTSPSGRKAQYSYDSRGQRLTMTDPLSGWGGSLMTITATW